MKLSTGIIASLMVPSATAFMSPSASTSFSLRMSEESAPVSEIEESVFEESAVVDTPTETALPSMSQSMPFMARPMALDGSLAGDVGFDPLGFAKSSEDLMKFREAEIKHARLAMLAAAGWPVSELFDAKLAKLFGMTPIVDAADRAPSVLNGGLGKVSPVYWVACLAGAAAIDLYGIMKASKKTGYTPGDLGFDPLGVFPDDAEGQQWMETAEIKNGRLAMIAITAFAFQELVTKIGVVDETPLFFKPFGETIHEYANAGYIYH